MIVLLAPGSRGDVQPFVALGVALQQLGHVVRVVASQAYASLVTEHGLDFAPIRLDMSGYAENDAVQAASSADNPIKVLLSFQKMKKYAAQMQADLFDGCKGASLVAYHPGAAIGYYYAKQHSIPAILAAPFPMAKTQSYPSVLFYGRMAGNRVWNPLTYSVLHTALWTASRQPIQTFWKERFGIALENVRCPFSLQQVATAPTIVSCEPALFPHPGDVSPHVHHTGYWFLDEDEDFQPPQALIDFLDAGERPVYIGYGSVTLPERAATIVGSAVKALSMTGMRAVIATGGVNVAGAVASDSLYLLESVPHSWLFPKMAAVVHHGGAGTTAEGLRAGVPTVVIPFANDQFAWGARVHELGVGAKPLPQKKITAAGLAEALQSCRQPEVIRKAEDLGKRIRATGGARNAALIVNDLLAGTTPDAVEAANQPV